MPENPENEGVKLSYFDYLKHADGRSEQTVRQVERAIARFEKFTKQANFRTFDQKQAVAFKDYIRAEGLAPATVNSIINAVQRFPRWLRMQAGYKRAIKPSTHYTNSSIRKGLPRLILTNGA